MELARIAVWATIAAGSPGYDQKLIALVANFPEFCTCSYATCTTDNDIADVRSGVH